jgi:hypothetical protein
MKRQKRSLSPEDQKAVDVVLDHAAHAGSSPMTRMTTAVSPKRVAAVTKLLHLLDAMPAIDPPQNLAARTMARIDREQAERATHASQISMPSSAHLH